jgi:single-stranded DNA-binding protein
MSGIECAFFGALGRDAEPKTSKAGKPYLRLSVRVGDGDDVQWITVLCFDADAIASADRYLRGARVYCEGRLSLNEWTNADGVVKTGLSALSWHCRLSQIGRNKVKRDTEQVSVAAGTTYHSPRSAPAGRLPVGNDFHDDDVGF